jgi:hypothetical protein
VQNSVKAHHFRAQFDAVGGVSLIFGLWHGRNTLRAAIVQQYGLSTIPNSKRRRGIAPAIMIAATGVAPKVNER